MAPSTISLPIDWRVQVIENCKFISRPGAFVSVVTTKEALGEFKAVVIRIQDGQRQPLFSESAATIPEALKALHTRSAEAVQNHVDANGWDFVMLPQKYWSKHETEKDQGESDAESSYSQSDSSTVTMSDASDEDMVSVGGHPSRKDRKTKKKNKKSKTSRKTKGRMGRSRSPSPSRSRSRSGSRSTERSRSRSGSPGRSRSASVGSAASSSGDEASRASSRPPHSGFRPSHRHPCPPNRMRPAFPPNYPPGWESSKLHAPPAPISFPPHAQGMRGPSLPHPPPPMGPPQFPNVPPPHHIPSPPRFQVQPQQQISKDKGTLFGMPGASQGDNDEGKVNTTKPSTGYNPFTTVFWPPAPTPASAPAPTSGLSAPYDILLDIRWPDLVDSNKTHQHRVLEQIPRLSAAVIKESALKYVRREMSGSGKGAAGSENGGSNWPNLCASLRKVGIKGAICHLSDRHSDDLYSLIHDMSSEQSRLSQNRQNGFATFDIEVYIPAGNNMFRETNFGRPSSSETWQGAVPPGKPPGQANVPPPPPGWTRPGTMGPSPSINNNNQKKPATTSMNTHASRRKIEPVSQGSTNTQQQPQAASIPTFTGVNAAPNNNTTPPTSTIPLISPLPAHLQQPTQAAQVGKFGQPVGLRGPALQQHQLRQLQAMQLEHQKQFGYVPMGIPIPASFIQGSAAPPPPPPPPPMPPMQMQMPFASCSPPSGSAGGSNKKKHRHRGSSSKKRSGSEKVDVPESMASSIVSDSAASEASSSATTMRFMEEEEVCYESDA